MPAATADSVLRTEFTERTLTIFIEGRLDSNSTGNAWRSAELALDERRPGTVVFDATGMTYVDGAGIALYVQLRDRLSTMSVPFVPRGIAPTFQPLFDEFPAGALDTPPRPPRKTPFVESIGYSMSLIFRDVRAQLAFTGELIAEVVRAVIRPGSVRWGDTFRIVEQAGVNAFPIMALIGFLIGGILAMNSFKPLKELGMEIKVCEIVSRSVIMELGPLITAIILAGRSGSAFAAEIGTMRVNEEVNALTTMGIQSVRFLVVPRVLAAVFVTPLLNVFVDLFALAGGMVFMWVNGISPGIYCDQVIEATKIAHLPAGLFKALVFGLLVAGIGCLRGLQTGTGASAVGQSTTRAVVAGIVLIILSDGLLTLAYSSQKWF